MAILNNIGKVAINIILWFNNFFNINIRDSESGIIKIVWTTSVAIGWVKFLFELKNIIDFFVRHCFWGWAYPRFWKSYVEKKDLFLLYGSTKNVRRRSNQNSSQRGSNHDSKSNASRESDEKVAAAAAIGP